MKIVETNLRKSIHLTKKRNWMESFLPQFYKQTDNYPTRILTRIWLSYIYDSHMRTRILRYIRKKDVKTVKAFITMKLELDKGVGESLIYEILNIQEELKFFQINE